MMLERMSRPPRTTDADVSSHEVSMPRTSVLSSHSPIGFFSMRTSGVVHNMSLIEDSQCLELVADALESHAEVGRPSVVDNHHVRILVRFDVVALAHADDRESELLVHRLRAAVRHSDLQRDRLCAAGDGLGAQTPQKAGADL